MYSVDIVKIVAITVSGFIFFAVIELIRRDHLKERYSIVWLTAAIVLVVFASWRGLLHFIALKLGIYYPPSFLFLLAIAFLLVLLLHFSTVISSQSDHNKRLAQEIGILRSRLDSLEKGDASKDSDLLKSGMADMQQQLKAPGKGNRRRR